MSETNSGLAKTSCIVNPKAAKNKWLRRKKLRAYLQKKLPGKIYSDPDSKKSTTELVKKLSLDNKTIIAIGGDGTIADVMQGIIEAQRANDVCMGIVPLGSGNAFRKSLRIPRSAKKAVNILEKGRIKKIDLIDVEGRVTGFISIGATAAVTQHKLQHKIPGLFGHLLASKKLFSFSKKEQEIVLIEGMDDKGIPFSEKKLKLKLLDCVIAKTNYFGYSWRIAPKAKLDDGYLDITLFETSSLKYTLLFPLIYFGLYQKALKHYKAKNIIVSGSELPIQYNGEFLGVKDRVEAKILPRAINIICPIS